MNTPLSACPVCAAADLAPLARLPAVPVHCNVLWPTQAEALQAPRGDLDLAVCANCGHVFNRAFDPARMEYTQAYENSLHFSPRFQIYAETLAADLVTRHGLRGKTVIEIGCGKGEFLGLLCALGENRGLGFDPSYVPDPDAEAGRFTVLPEFYSERHAHYQADLVAGRHVLEHIPEPRPFLASLRRSVGDRPATVVFFEVPNVLYTLRDLGIWDLIYEHCGYYSASSLALLFAQSGFAVRAVAEQYGGQFLTLEAAPDLSGAAPAPDLTEAHRAVLAGAAAFTDAYRTKVTEWRERLEQWRRAGRRAVVWGAGSKGVTFLNTLAAADVIARVVALNPRKQGRYVAGTGQPIVAPAALVDDRPEAVIVMNPLYQAEIEQQLGQLGVAAEVVCA